MVFSPWKINKLILSGTSKNCEIHYGTLFIHNKQRPSGQKIPLEISVSSNAKEFVWKLKSGMMKSPAVVYVRELSCFVPQLKRKIIRFDGEFEFYLAKLKLLEYYNIKNVGKINPVRKMIGRFNRTTKNWQIQTSESGKHAGKKSLLSRL